MTRTSQGEREFWTAWRRFKPAGFPDPQCTENGGELAFAKESLGRGWKIDFAWAAPHKLSVEIDGATHLARWSKKLKRCVAVGRHAGRADYEKRNAAILLGWRPLAFTTEMIRRDPAGCIWIVAQALKMSVP